MSSIAKPELSVLSAWIDLKESWYYNIILQKRAIVVLK
jgi:hypothetical protein